MVTSQRISHFRSQNPTRSSRIARVGSVSSRLISFLVLALLAILYVAQATKAGTKRVEVQKWRNQAETLQQDNAALELELKRAGSLTETNAAASRLQLESVQTMEFLSSQPGNTASPSPQTSPSP